MIDDAVDISSVDISTDTVTDSDVVVSPNVVTVVPEGTVPITARQADSYQWVGIPEAELHEAYVVSSGSEAFAFLRMSETAGFAKVTAHEGEMPI